MRRLTVGIAALAVLLGTVSAAEAGWVWRDGKWIYDESIKPPPPPEPRAPKAPEQPAPEQAEPKKIPAKPAPTRPTPAPAERTPAEPAPPDRPPAPAQVQPARPPSAEPAPARPRRAELPDTEKPARPKKEKSWWDRAKWWEKPPPPGRDEPLFNQGAADFQAGNHRRAEKTFHELIKDYPESPSREEAMWLRAESLFARERYYKAYEQYEDLIEQYAGSRRYQDALRKEIEVAELYLGPVRRRVLGIPLMSGEGEAIEILRRVYEHQPSGDLADNIILRIADYYWSKHKWPDAEEYYDKYCKEYPNGEAVRHAELRRAECAIRQCEGPRYSTTTLRLARDRLRQFQEKYPEEAARHDVPAMLERLRDLQAQSLYEIAARYRRSGHPCAAAFYAERLRGRYPDSDWSLKAADFLAPNFEPAPPAHGPAEVAGAPAGTEASEPPETMWTAQTVQEENQP